MSGRQSIMRLTARKTILHLALAALGVLRAAPALAGAPPDGAPDPVEAHHTRIGDEAARRTIVQVPLGNVQLVREDGASVNLNALLRADRPVYVDFVYTTCAAICPIMSATFAALQQKLGAARDGVNLISISIDPEEDTPRRLRDFRKKYDAGDAWHFYTGTLEASIAAQRAFGVFTGDKMLHAPVMLFRAAPGAPWVRFDGFTTPDELLRELPHAPVAGR